MQSESQVQFLASDLHSKLAPSNLQSLLQTKRREDCNLMSDTIIKPIVLADSQVKQSNLMSCSNQDGLMSFRDNN